jgi:hypothetical protein
MEIGAVATELNAAEPGAPLAIASHIGVETLRHQGIAGDRPTVGHNRRGPVQFEGTVEDPVGVGCQDRRRKAEPEKAREAPCPRASDPTMSSNPYVP